METIEVKRRSLQYIIQKNKGKSKRIQKEKYMEANLKYIDIFFNIGIRNQEFEK